MSVINFVKEFFLIGFLLTSLFIFVPGASAATYYVRTDGNNACNGQYNNSGFSGDCSFQTITYGLTKLVAGDTLRVQQGTYNENNLSVPSGTSSNWVTVMGDASPIINATTNGFSHTNNSYITIEGFIVQGYSEVGYYQKGSSNFSNVKVINNNFIGGKQAVMISQSYGIYGTDILVQDNDCSGQNAGGIRAVIDTGSGANPKFERITIDGNNIHDIIAGSGTNGIQLNGKDCTLENNTLDGTGSGLSAKGITMGGALDNGIHVLNNIVSNWARGVRCDFDGYNIEIGHNNIINSGGIDHGLDLYPWSPTTLPSGYSYQFWVHDNILDNSGVGIFNNYQDIIENNIFKNANSALYLLVNKDANGNYYTYEGSHIIRNNTFAGRGMEIDSIYGNITITNNRFYNKSGSHSFIYWHGEDNNGGLFIANNDFYNANGLNAIDSDPTAGVISPVVIKNNIFHTVASALSDSSSRFGNLSIRYNNVYLNSGSAFGSKVNSNTITQDPLFADLTVYDFHLRSQAGRWTGTAWIVDVDTSPLIDTGDSSDVYANEPSPNGGRINIGSYGNTIEASKSLLQSYSLTVTNGTGSGSYTQNQSITITANPPAIGKEFDKWTGDIASVTDINSSTTTVAMPSSTASLTATYKDTTSVATPTFSPTAGTYTSTQTVTITSTTSNATIYYTTDGSTPTISSSLYFSPITVSATQTIKAIAIKSGLSNSTIGSAAYTISPVSIVATPIFSLAAGTYAAAQTITISSTTSGATIYYTTDGNSPSVSSTQYTTPIAISSTTTIKAIAVKTGLTNSSIASAIFTITPTTTGTTGTTGGTTGAGTTGGSGTTPITPIVTKVEITKTEGNILILNVNVQNATQMMLSDSSSFLGSIWETYYSTKLYTKGLTQTKLYLKFKSSTDTVSSTIELNIPTNTTTTTSTSDTPNLYPTGTLLKLPDSFKVYVIIGGNKKWIPTPEVFEQLGYKWTEIKILTPTEFNTIPDFEDNLIRAINDYKVYLVVNGVKRHIPNPIIFLDYGFKWNEVKDVPQSTIGKYKPTYLIKQSGLNGIYYVNPQEIRKLIPSTEVFNSYNDKTEDIQIISKTEMDFYPLSNLIKLNGSNDIYLIEGNTKRRIPNPQVFNKYKLNWNLVMSVNQTEFNFYQDGGELK